MKKQNLQVKFLVAATVAVSTFLAPLTGVIAEATTITAKSGVNLRSSTSAYSSKIGYAAAGTNVKYLGVSNGYYKVSVDGKIAYTYNSYWKGNTVTATSNVNMRSGANSTSSKVGYVYSGSEPKLLGRNGNWVYIEHNGKKGFAYKSYFFISSTLFNSLPYVSSSAGTTSSTTSAVTIASSSTAIGDRVVAEAKKLLGAPYVWGGESWSEGGFDCSGLTQYVYGRVGYQIGRTVTNQWYGETRVSASTRKPGDIIVMTDGYSISHAGIYIGDNKMIHSPRPGKVVEIKSLDWYQSEGRIKGYLRPYWGN